jgi:geranylgeranyl diphosphate synthase, type II
VLTIFRTLHSQGNNIKAFKLEIAKIFMGESLDFSVITENIEPEIVKNLEKTISVSSARVELPNELKRKVIVDAMRYFCFPVGHMWRPRLMLGVAQSYMVNRDLAMTFASLGEGVHASTLAEDDKPDEDNGLIRRRKPSCWKYFSEMFARDRGYDKETADKAGTMITTFAVHQMIDNVLYRILSASEISTERRIDIHNEFLGAKGVLIDGQINDVLYTKFLRNLDDFEDFYAQKTGMLFALAASVGAKLGGEKGEKDVKNWRDFGIDFGRAYQESDDLLEKKGVDARNKTPEDYSRKQTIFDVADVGEILQARENRISSAREYLSIIGEKKTSRVRELVDFMDNKFRERFNSKA